LNLEYGGHNDVDHRIEHTGAATSRTKAAAGIIAEALTG